MALNYFLIFSFIFGLIALYFYAYFPPINFEDPEIRQKILSIATFLRDIVSLIFLFTYILSIFTEATK